MEEEQEVEKERDEEEAVALVSDANADVFDRRDIFSFHHGQQVMWDYERHNWMMVATQPHEAAGDDPNREAAGDDFYDLIAVHVHCVRTGQDYVRHYRREHVILCIVRGLPFES